MSEQLNLFGESSEGVRPAPESPLSAPAVNEMLTRWPGLYLGTCSWTFPGWAGLVYQREYSKPELARKGLKAYAGHRLFRTVSLDRTYYRPMETREYEELTQQVPAEFKFLVKAPRDLIACGPRGIDLSEFSREFLTPMVRGLGDHLGVVLLQYPPGTVKPSDRYFVPALGRFLRGVPNSVPFSLEIRDAEALSKELRRELEGTRISLCSSVHSSLPDPDVQLLRVPPVPDGPLVFRWNLRPSLNYEEARGRFAPFNTVQMEDPRRRTLLARLIFRALKAGRSVYVVANNKAEGCAPLTLLRLLEELSSQKD